MKAFLKSTTPISARIFGVIGTVLAGQLTEASVPSPIRGATIYSLCSTCHGLKGEGVHKLETPPLTGLSANYVESQLRKFRDGRRGAHHADVKGLMMRAMARVLIRDEDLVAVSKFVGSLPSDLTDQTQQPKPPNIAPIAETCLGCHAGKGETHATPPLWGRGTDYILSQLDKFGEGTRGYHPDNHEAQLMGAIARQLKESGTDRQQLVEHLNVTRKIEEPDAISLCGSCHGSNLHGNRWLGVPSIAGLDDWYIADQLRHFQTGVRGTHSSDANGRMMSLAAKILIKSDEIESVSKKIAALPPKPQKDNIGGDPEKGKNHYALCMACHGLGGEGNKQLHAPSHVPLEDWYALEQLKKFKSGVRGAHPDDIWAKSMIPILAALPDDEALRDVVAYMRTLAQSN